jgi:hypothetical protein
MGHSWTMLPYQPRLLWTETIIFAIEVGEAKKSQLSEITNDQDKVYYEEKIESV